MIFQHQITNNVSHRIHFGLCFAFWWAGFVCLFVYLFARYYPRPMLDFESQIARGG